MVKEGSARFGPVQQWRFRFFRIPRRPVLTNHHVASDTIQKLSSAEKDYVENGFLARTRAEEQKAPDLELNQLVNIEDVTDRVNAGVKEGMSPTEINTARRTAVIAIEKDATAKTGLRSDVVILYQGGKYNLYQYKRYTDVRLVFAPESDIAFFGGDPGQFRIPEIQPGYGALPGLRRQQTHQLTQTTSSGRRRVQRPVNWCLFQVIPVRLHARTPWRISSIFETPAYH